MQYKHKIQLRKTTRAGRNKLKAIVTVSMPSNSSMESVDSVRRATRLMQTDDKGILWLVINEPATVKVYPVK